MSAALHIQVAGLLTIGVALAHGFFPKHFGWRDDVGKLTLINREIFYVHFGFVVLVLMMLGTLSLGWSAELASGSGLARPLLAGMALFWAARLAVQFLGYSPELWRGVPARTAIHALLTIVWSYLAATYAIPLAL